MHAPELSIVLPCLNEERTISICVRKARTFLDQHSIDGEIIVADNGSTDRSVELATAAGVRIVHVQEKGYGSALRGGIDAALGTFVIMGDADDSYDFSVLMPFVEKLRQGHDLVMGNRFQGEILSGAMPFLHRYIGNPLLSAIANLFFPSPIHDYHCGLRGFRAEAIRRLDLRTSGMEFATEMVIKASFARLRMTEVPITLSPDGRAARSHLRTWRDGWRHLRLMLLYSPNWLFLYPGVALTVVGITLGGWLLPTQRSVFDVHTLLYCSVMIVLGVQAIFFALFTKVFAMNAGLLPPGPLLNRIYGRFSLEIGLLIGLFLFFAGICLSVYAVLFWQETSFSDLDPRRMLRIVIPAVTLLFTGSQIIFASFFLSILGIPRSGARHEGITQDATRI